MPRFGGSWRSARTKQRAMATNHVSSKPAKDCATQMSTFLPLVAVHALLLLSFVLAATMASGEVATSLWSISAGLGISQTVLLGTFSSLACASFFYRIRWSYRLLVLQWLCFSIPLLAVTKERPMPWSVLVSELSLFIGAFLVGWILRLVTRRSLTFESAGSSKPRSVNGLIDLFTLVTIISIFLGVTLRYNEDLPSEMFSGIGYILMIAVSVSYGMPFSATLAVVTIGYGVKNSTFAWYWWRTWFACASVLFVVLQVLFSQSNEHESVSFRLPISFIFVSAFMSTIVSAMYLRCSGIRFRRLTSTSPPIATLQEVATP